MTSSLTIHHMFGLRSRELERARKMAMQGCPSNSQELESWNRIMERIARLDQQIAEQIDNPTMEES